MQQCVEVQVLSPAPSKTKFPDKLLVFPRTPEGIILGGRLAEEISNRAIEATQKLMTSTDYANAAFHVEWMYDKEKDKLWIVEINLRISQSHSKLFRLVDSVSDMSVPINIALDIDPARPRLKGDFKHAAKYYMRVKDNALVKSVPTAKDISKLQEKYSEVSVHLTIEEGQKLSDLKVEDSYTYCIAEIYLGAQSEEELLEKIDICKSMLPFELEKC